MWVSSNIEVPSYNNYCRWKAISITYSDCVFIVLDIRYTLRMRRSIYGLLGSKIFLNITHKRHVKKKNFEHKVCVLIFSRAFVRNISYSKKDLTMYNQKYALVFI